MSYVRYVGMYVCIYVVVYVLVYVDGSLVVYVFVCVSECARSGGMYGPVFVSSCPYVCSSFGIFVMYVVCMSLVS